MTFRVRLTKDAQQDLTRLDGTAQKAVLKGLTKLQIDPYGYGHPLGKKTGSKSLEGDLTGFRKLVVGNREYRVIYMVGDAEIVVVWVISGRADDKVYRLAMSRLKTMSQRSVADELEKMVRAVWRG